MLGDVLLIIQYIHLIISLNVYHHVLLEVVINGYLAGLIVNKRVCDPLLVLIHIVVVLEGLLISELRIDLDLQGPLVVALLLRLLDLHLLSHPLFLLDHGCVSPLIEELRDSAHAVIGIEQGSHGVQQVFILLEV